MIVLMIAEVELGREKDVSKRLAKVDGVAEVYVMTGEYDILARAPKWYVVCLFF